MIDMGEHASKLINDDTKKPSDFFTYISVLFIYLLENTDLEKNELLDIIDRRVTNYYNDNNAIYADHEINDIESTYA